MREIEAVPSALSIAHSHLIAEVRRSFGRCCEAVRAEDEFCRGITSSQMLEACQLTVCQEQVDNY